MKRILALSTCFSLALAGAALAGEITSTLEVTGGSNAFAALKLLRADDGPREEGILKVQVVMTETQNLKGYGFVLNYDPAKYELVETQEVQENLLATGSGEPALFLSSNRTPGRVTVGAMKVDGEGASGEGRLLTFTFRTAEMPVPGDFEIGDGVLVDMEGNMDAIQNVEIGDLKPIPDNYALDQNMPNPFNPSTTIGYQLPEDGRAKLVIYNLLGQEVRVLVDESLKAGYYTILWDGMDVVGRQVASGIYIYRIQAGKFSQTRRMMLLK